MPNPPGHANESTDQIALRRNVRGSLSAWAELALARESFRPARHHRLILSALQRISGGTSDRLMLLMPPGSAKSTYTSVLFPAWWLQAHPRGLLVACSHTNALAKSFARRMRALIGAHGGDLEYEVPRGYGSTQDFSTSLGSGYLGVGVHAHITGRRADLVVIDDPIAGIAEAMSPKARERLWDWYRADLASRLKPGGAIVLATTRWHHDDLAGRLLGSADRWDVIKLPAIAEGDDQMGRAPGEALWPEWEDEAALERKRAMVGERTWAGLYQQQPLQGQQRVFSISHLNLIDDMPDMVAMVRAWDLAATADLQGDPAWTVGVKMGRTQAGGFVVMDVARSRVGPAEVERLICRSAKQDGKAVRISLPQDPGQAGRSQSLYLIRQLAGFSVTATPETGSKLIRAMPVSAQVGVGNVSVLRASWTQSFIDELGDFPDGRKDDQVDAFSRAFAALMDAPARLQRSDIGFLAR